MRGTPRVHRQGAQLVDAHATCLEAPSADYDVQIFYSADGKPVGGVVDGELIGTITIKAGEIYGMVSLDGQVMKPWESLVWPVLDDFTTRPKGLGIVVGCDRARR